MKSIGEMVQQNHHKCPKCGSYNWVSSSYCSRCFCNLDEAKAKK